MTLTGFQNLDDVRAPHGTIIRNFFERFFAYDREISRQTFDEVSYSILTSLKSSRYFPPMLKFD